MYASWLIVGFLLFSFVPQNSSFKPFKLPVLPVLSFRKPVLNIPVVARVPDVGLISIDPNRIRFLLYSDASNPSKFEVLEYRKIDSVRRSSYDPSKPTKFLVHGFVNNFNSMFPQNVKDAYLKKISEHPHNVIVVDWGPLAVPNAPIIAPLFYPLAVNNVWKTGIRLGEFISWLKNDDLIDLNKVHIIGFSLGSHVAGKAGDWIQKKHGQRVRRITALDPAGPAFQTGIFARKLSKDDAQYVDAIHTNAAQLGTWNRVGHADFFINGGTGLQPGCIGFGSVQKWFKAVEGALTGKCSHEMSTKFFAKTILDDVRKAKDSKQVVFGENSPPEYVNFTYSRNTLRKIRDVNATPQNVASGMAKINSYGGAKLLF